MGMSEDVILDISLDCYEALVPPAPILKMVSCSSIWPQTGSVAEDGLDLEFLVFLLLSREC